MVKRYGVEEGLYEDNDGDFVSYEDYAVIRAELTRLREVAEAARKLLLDSEYFTRERCSDVGQEYGKGTDAEDDTRAALRAYDAARKGEGG